MKKIIIIMLVLAMCVGLFACNNQLSEEPTDSESVDTGESESESKKEPTSSETATVSEESVSEDIDSESETKSETESESVSASEETGTDATETESSSETESITEDLVTEEVTEDKTEENTTEEEESEEMESEHPVDDLASVGKYEQYDLDSYMTPIWDGSHETCNEEVLRSVVEILRSINLLDNTVLHNYDSGTKGHCLGLVMGYVDNGSL